MNASDWVSIITSILMVLITGAYVIATIKIQKANEKAAKASNDQLEESKRQFNENRRLDVMPYLQFEAYNDPLSDYSLDLALFGHNLSGTYTCKLCVKNIGRGTAKDISYTWINFEGQYDRPFPFSALQNREKLIIKTNFGYELKEPPQNKACFDLRYKDLLEHEYSQKIEFLFSYDLGNNFIYLTKMVTNPPVLAEQTNKIG